MNKKTIEDIINLVEDNKDTSHTGRTLLPTHVVKKIAVLMGGNYNNLNKTQKAVFRSDCLSMRMSEWEYYILL